MSDENEHCVTGVEMIAAERRRQIDIEGWTPEHDNGYTGGELIDAAAAYEIAAMSKYFSETCVTFRDVRTGEPPETWPWPREWWKPSEDPVRNLVKAGALIAAEIDRLKRKGTK